MYRKNYKCLGYQVGKYTWFPSKKFEHIELVGNTDFDHKA